MKRGLFSLLILVACHKGAGKPDPSGEATPSPAKAASVVVEEREEAPPPETALDRARRFARGHILLDGHVDLPWRLYEGRAGQDALSEDVASSTPTGDFDFPRATQGGLNAPFMSIYVPSKYEKNGARKLADELIGIVESVIASAPEKFAAARSVADIEANFAAGRISLPMGMENGSPIEGDLENLDYFYDRGIRYITLTHAKDNHISDSSYDGRHTHAGLSTFGRKVVRRMNTLGIMIDVSHLSDQAFWHVLDASRAPVIASHSSCRHFTPGFERNMSDDMIRALAEKGGVIQINFGSSFIDDEVRRERDTRREAIEALLDARGLLWDDPKSEPIKARYDAEHPLSFATVEQVADHIEHVIALVGVDHVGLGSDFDGVGDSLPIGLKDVSAYPALLAVLIERGHSDEDLEKICAKNVLRVWGEVETFASKH